MTYRIFDKKIPLFCIIYDGDKAWACNIINFQDYLLKQRYNVDTLRGGYHVC